MARAHRAVAILACLVLAGCGNRSSTEPVTTTATPSSAPTSSPTGFVAPTTATVQHVIDLAVPRGTVGVQVAISRAGRVVFSGGFGQADLRSRRPVTATTRFGIGSLTKQVTAALVLRLVDSGRLSLRDTVDTLLPAASWRSHPDVEELLQHTSGLSRRLPPAGVARRGRDAIDGFIARQPAESPPGRTWAYSNTGYLVLGDIVGRLSAHPFQADADALWPTSSGTRCGAGLATAYDATSDPPRPVRTVPVVVSGAAGGLCSTASDLLAWQQQLLADTGVWQQMTSVSPQSRAAGTPYGMGLYVDDDLVWHDGLLPSTSDPRGGDTAYLAWLPHEQIGVAVLANTVGRYDGDARAVGEALVRDLKG